MRRLRGVKAMMAGLFLLYFVAMILAWVQKRQAAIMVFLVAIVLSLFWFMHHATDRPDIML
jgi:4-hydroxybenzoate polyprenyltransferase